MLSLTSGVSADAKREAGGRNGGGGLLYECAAAADRPASAAAVAVPMTARLAFFDMPPPRREPRLREATASDMPSPSNWSRRGVTKLEILRSNCAIRCRTIPTALATSLAVGSRW